MIKDTENTKEQTDGHKRGELSGSDLRKPDDNIVRSETDLLTVDVNVMNALEPKTAYQYSVVIRDESDDDQDVEVDVSKLNVIYGVMENPPLHVTLVCALQQGLLALSGHLIVSLLVAEAVCAADNDEFKARLLSSTLFMSGVTTIAMNLFGIRLPVFQSGTSGYAIPLLLIASVDSTFCSSFVESSAAVSSNDTGIGPEASMERILNSVRSLQGSLMLAGFIHALIGLTGLVGLLLRFVGPLTIVPAMTLIFIFLARPALSFVEVNWPIALSTVGLAVVLCLYLSKYQMPIPVWTPSAGCRVIRYPLHQVFAILISVLVNWALCGILTVTGVLTDDRENIGYRARTDARLEVIEKNPWFTFPYPGQFGPIGFSGSAFLACIIATLMSVLDSIGDYYACARVCRVPVPPKHAVNRGILIEGICSILSGLVGCGHATTTAGGNIGAVGISKVASRRVFFFTGILYILFGLFGKFSALFITMPYPVLGGAVILMFGIFYGVVLSNLEVTKLSSPRNIAIIGLSIFMGLIVPMWIQRVKTPFHTGSEKFDKLCAMLLANPNLVGTIIAVVLDNTVAGTLEERGIATLQEGDGYMSKIDPAQYNEGYEVYQPLIPERVLSWPIVKYIPFLPYRGNPDSN